MVPTMNSFEILWPHKQLTDQIQKAKEIQRHTLSRRPLWSTFVRLNSKGVPVTLRPPSKSKAFVNTRK